MREKTSVSQLFYRILKVLFSYKTSMLYLGIFAIAVAVATFIENDFTTRAAREVVYDATWFEILLLLVAISIVWNIFDRNINPRQTFTVFIFHISFIIVLLGAGMTRYFSEEGIMHIREGQATDRYITLDAYMDIEVASSGDTVRSEEQVTFSTFSEGQYDKTIKTDNQDIHFQSTRFVPSAGLYTTPAPNGQPVLELMMVIDGQSSTEFFNHREVKSIGSFTVSFDDTLADADLFIMRKGGKLRFKSPHQVKMVNKDSWSEEAMEKGKSQKKKKKRLYKIGDTQFVLKKYLEKGQIHAEKSDSDEKIADALFMKISSKDETLDVLLLGGPRTTGQPATLHLNGIKTTIRYGSKTKHLPFSLELKDFIMKRYPATNSPSSFRSELTLIDNKKDIRRPVSIFMNNILYHRGYRFYQTSYDKDEKGTFLTVNRDVPGTQITYVGYLLVVLGMFSSLFNKKSRFVK